MSFEVLFMGGAVIYPSPMKAGKGGREWGG